MLEDRIWNLKDEMIKSLQVLIAIPSKKAEPLPGMPFGKDINDSLSYVLSLCDSFGFRTKNCDGYIGYAEVGEGEDLLGILVHLDVVPEGNGWEYPSYGGEIHNESIYGRGAVDDKGPAISCIYALKTLVNEAVELNMRVRIIFGLDEESDWEDIEYYLANEESPTIGFTPDADFPVIYSEKGLLSLTLVSKPIEGLTINGGEAVNAVPDFCHAEYMDQSGSKKCISETGISAHASTPEVGQNAISAMMCTLKSLRESGDMKVGKLDFIDFYCDKIGMGHDGLKFGLDVHENHVETLTMNAGVIKGNEDNIELHLDIRYPAIWTKDEILSIMINQVRKYDIQIQVEDHMTPVFREKDGEFIRLLLSVYREVTGDLAEPLTMGGGTYAHAFSTIVAFGPNFPGRECTEHKCNEHLRIDDFVKMTEIYARTIVAIAGGGMDE